MISHPAKQSKLVKKKLNPFIYCSLLFFLALFLRLFYGYFVLANFAKLTLQEQNSFEIGYYTSDSPGYLEPARNLLEGNFVGAVSLARPIGYPVLLAIAGLDATVIIIIQALLLSVIPICTFLIVLLCTGNSPAGFAAGLISCISPTGVALGALIMSDALFSVLFSMLFIALAYGANRGSLQLIFFSAFLSGIAILVKPVLIFWPGVSIVIYYLFIRGERGLGTAVGGLYKYKKYWKEPLILFLVPLSICITWAGVNYSYNGFFTVSTIGSDTIRIYLATKVEAWENTGKRPSGKFIGAKQKILRDRLAKLPNGERQQIVYEETLAIIKKYPARTIKVLLENAIGNYLRGWNLFRYQLSLSQEKLGRFFRFVYRVESMIKKVVLLPFLFAPLIAFAVSKVRHIQNTQQLVKFLYAMFLSFFYFFVLSGITFWTGPRILYPTETLIISVLAIICHLFAKRA